MVGRIERGDPDLDRRDQAGDDEIPEKELHDQRNIAEQLNIGVAAAGEPARLGSARDAHYGAQHKGHDPRAQRDQQRPLQAGGEHLPPRAVAVRDLLQEDVQIHYISQ